MQTIREFGDFYKDAITLLGEEGYKQLITTIAANPEIGDIMVGTGGFRKMRFARPGGGKSGGVRVIYFTHAKDAPISLMMIYAKSTTDNLTDKQKKQMYELAQIIKKGR